MATKVSKTFDLIMYHFFFFEKIKNNIISVKLAQVLWYKVPSKYILKNLEMFNVIMNFLLIYQSTQLWLPTPSYVNTNVGRVPT
jgi:hypothetical protein